MSVIAMKQLLEAGVHFGHQTRKWNPKMARYIFTSRNDIHVINLEQTAELIDSAYAYVRDAVKDGKTVLFVGTKKQAQDAVKEEAERCGMYYVNSRWLGGTLTNFKTIRSRVEKLNKLDQMEKTGEFDLLPKKEVAGLKAETDKLDIVICDYYRYFDNGNKEEVKLPNFKNSSLKDNTDIICEHLSPWAKIYRTDLDGSIEIVSLLYIRHSPLLLLSLSICQSLGLSKNLS